MITAIVGLLAILLEVVAVFWLMPLQQGDPTRLLGFLAVHGVASLCLAAFLSAALPPHFRRPVPPIILLLFVFSFFIPILGLIGQLIAVIVAKYLPRLVPELPFAEIPPIEFEFPPREIRERTKYGPGGLASRLRDPGIGKEARFKSLLALQGMPPRIANPLLQEMLGDPADEVRLVAYGILDNQEKSINQHIHDEFGKLAATEARELRLISLRRLAELYWELVYGGLVHGDVRQYALGETNRYLDQAMQIAPDDAGLWFLKGKLLLVQRDPPAEAAFHRAVANGLDESRVLAYLGEIAFERRDYAEVRRIFSSLSEGQYAPRLKQAVKYWATGAASRSPT
ncbi:MAG: tetratricopeptide repeat protein [Burkholderiales bacterium]